MQPVAGGIRGKSYHVGDQDHNGIPIMAIKPIRYNKCLAERQGFEPWEALPSLVFKTSAFDRSATSPATVILFALCGPIKTASDIRPTFA